MTTIYNLLGYFSTETGREFLFNLEDPELIKRARKLGDFTGLKKRITQKEIRELLADPLLSNQNSIYGLTHQLDTNNTSNVDGFHRELGLKYNFITPYLNTTHFENNLKINISYKFVKFVGDKRSLFFRLPKTRLPMIEFVITNIEKKKNKR